MVDGKSLVGLTHSEAVGVLKMTQQLVQLVVATEVRERREEGREENGKGRGGEEDGRGRGGGGG